MTTRAKVRASTYRRVPGYTVSQGRAPFGVSIFVRTRAAADYIADLVSRRTTANWDDLTARIDRALRAESDPWTCFPPPGAGDVVGAS